MIKPLAMKLKLLLFTILLFNQLPAQINFFQTGAKWGYSTLEHPDWFGQDYRTWLTQHQITGDSVINNISYKMLFTDVKLTAMNGSASGGGVDYVQFYNYGPELLRFDSLANKLYYIMQGDSTEKILYDFSLTTGDTVPNPNYTGDYNIVDSIETISFFGMTVKKMYISQPGNGPDTSQYIIEGMGGSNGLTVLQTHAILVSSYQTTDLICFQSGTNVYPSGIGYCDLFSIIEEPPYFTPDISVYPNPFHGKVNFDLKNPYKNPEIKIYDFQGRLIHSKPILKNNTVELNSRGLYFWQIVNEGQVIGTGKIVNE